MKRIPDPSVQRLVDIYRVLGHSDLELVSSAQLERMTGIASHNIRKDFTYIESLSGMGMGTSGYRRTDLLSALHDALGFNRARRGCVVGLGRLGLAVIDHQQALGNACTICAGFDSDVNLVDTIHCSVPVYPSYQMEDIVRREGITLAALAVPRDAAQRVAERLADAGIKAILNFSPAVVTLDNREVLIRNADVLGELLLLSAQLEITR